MDVLNFAHGGLFAWGAYSGIWIYASTGSFFIGILGAVVTGLLLGLIIEKWIIKPVYGNHVQQILITLGLMLVLSELLKVVWGPNQISATPPDVLKGSWEYRGYHYYQVPYFYYCGWTFDVPHCAIHSKKDQNWLSCSCRSHE